MTRSSKRRQSVRPLGRAAACLASALVLAYMLAGPGPAPVRAQPALPKFQQKDLADQAAKARTVVFRCDIANGRREIGNLKKTKEGLDAAAKTGFVAAAAEDAKALDTEIQFLERLLAYCNDRNKVTGVDKQTYGFFYKEDADFAGKAVGDAQRAARSCDRDLFKAVIKALRDRAADIEKGGPGPGTTQAELEQNVTAVLALKQLARDLEAAEAELFKNCPPEPGKQAHTPPGTTTPAKPAETPPKATPTGPAPGERPGVPPKPGDPPKAPALDPGLPVMFIGGGAQFDNFKPTTLGTLFIPGNDRPFLTSRGSATGFRFSIGAEIPVRSLLQDALNIFESRYNETLVVGFAFSRSQTSVSGSSGPGDVPVLTLIQPFNGVTVLGFGTADAKIESSKRTINFFVKDRVQLTDTVNAHVGVRFVDRLIEHEGLMSSGVLPGFTADQRLVTHDSYIGPTVGIGFRNIVEVAPAFPLIMLSGEAWLAPSLRISSGSARQHVVIPGAAPPFNDFTVSEERNRVGFALLGGFNAGADLAVSPNFTVGIGGGLVFNTAQSHLVIPVSPGQTTSLRSGFQLSGNVQFRVRFRF